MESVELKIGVANCVKEISLNVKLTPEQLLQRVKEAVDNSGVLHLEDIEGEELIIPANALSYVMTVQEKKRVCGFVS